MLSASFLMFRLLLLIGTGKAREECAGKRVRGFFLTSHISPEPGCHLLQLQLIAHRERVFGRNSIRGSPKDL